MTKSMQNNLACKELSPLWVAVYAKTVYERLVEILTYATIDFDLPHEVIRFVLTILFSLRLLRRIFNTSDPDDTTSPR